MRWPAHAPVPAPSSAPEGHHQDSQLLVLYVCILLLDDVCCWRLFLTTSLPLHLQAVGQRLEGLILRSQLLVLLQRRHFVDAAGKPVGREYSRKYELELEVS